MKIYIDGLEGEPTEEWVSLPQDLPGWSLDGAVFEVRIPQAVNSFEDLRNQNWALRNAKHTPRPYLSLSELQERFLLQLGVDT